VSTLLLRGKQFPAPVENSGTMYGLRHSWLRLTLLFVLMATASSVQAQSWLADRKRAEGRGIRVGDLELHPGVGAEAGYLTNPFFSDRVRGSAAFRIAPHLFLSTLQSSRLEAAPGAEGATRGWIDFSGGLSGSFNHYFQHAIRDAINVDVNADVTLAPDRPVALKLTELLRRSALPFSDTNLPPEARDTQTAADYTNYYEAASAQVLFRSAGGLLRGSVGYRFGYAWFDDVGFKYNNNITHNGLLNLGWEFLPKTALFYDATFAHQSFTKGDDSSLRQIALTRLVDNNILTSRIGINGAITSRIGATVAIGYTAGFFESGDEPHGLIGSVEARFTPTQISEVALTFDRGFLPSYQGNYQDRTRIYARTRWLFVGALLLSARAGIEFLTFGYDPVQDATRDDRRYFGELSGEYRFVDWLALTGQASLLMDDTTFVYRVENNSDPAKFTAVELWLGVRAFL
jgi:hypothetical protein